MFYLFQENVTKTRNITKSFAGNDIRNVITPESEVIKKGQIEKISARNGKRQARYLFLCDTFSSMTSLWWLCQGYSKYRLVGRLSLEGMQILEDEDLEMPNSFVVKGKQKVIQLLAKSPEEKVEWQEAINDAIVGCSHTSPIC
ncbi:FYVE, RhoGEF and PH domain-containing protein 1, partial [Lamellibrachia satsuma]